MLTQEQIDAIVYASREADEGPTRLARRIEAAAAAAERERCAKLCEEMFSFGALDIADAIRGPND